MSLMFFWISSTVVWLSISEILIKSEWVITLISDDLNQVPWFGCSYELDKVQADCLLSQASAYRDQGCKINLDCQVVNDFNAMKKHLCKLAC